jgi:hypothetical protein
MFHQGVLLRAAASAAGMDGARARSPVAPPERQAATLSATWRAAAPAAGIGYLLILVGLAITLAAMGLDEWTRMRELELITGCLGLITSVAAAIIVACDPAHWRERA